MFPLRIIALLRLAWLACFLAAAAPASTISTSSPSPYANSKKRSDLPS
jgi:hypothetical protein